MEIFYEPAPGLIKQSSIALGFFDGVHPGHRVVIGKAVEEARRMGVVPGVVTFKDHPRALTRGAAPLLLTLIEQRLELFAELGVEVTLALSFTEDLCRLSPGQYVETVLVGCMGARSISVGYNHHFGKDREGDPALLKVMGEEFNFVVHVAPMVYIEGVEVSSSRVREAVLGGDMETAQKILSRPYALWGEVKRGDGRGKQLGFPTANLAVREIQLIPGGGVYAGRVRIEHGPLLPAVINVGYRPTFTDHNRGLIVEVHILDFNQDLYGKTVQLEFNKFLRAEQKFDGVEALCQQITADCAAARVCLRQLDDPVNPTGSKLHA